jgi:thiol-disulfide isomerase/thioredoxin
MAERHITRDPSERYALLPKWASAALVVVAALGLAALIWNLDQQNRQLRELVASARSVPAEYSLAEGETLPHLDLVPIETDKSELQRVLERGGVIAFFNTTCPHCEETLPLWNELRHDLAASSIGLVGISLHSEDQTSRYLANKPVTFPVFCFPDPTASRALEIRAIPLTVILRAGGEIVALRRGRLASASVVALRNAAEAVSGDR